ncbi:M4 family metallopeptidase [Tenacibaculum maritimum]|nr:M4 family metallopeptidase [Tenacibaculum maritimum]
MKKKYITSVLLSSFFFTGLSSVEAQELKKIKQIKLEKSSKYSLERAPELLKKKLKMSAEDHLMRVKTEVDDLGFTHEKYQQSFKGVKVEFATYMAHAKKGKLKTMNGEFYDVGAVNIIPKLSRKAAFDRALEHTGAEKYLWETPEAAKEMNNYKKPKGELLILPKEVIGTKEARLAYKFDIFATKPLSRGYLYIDAHTGEALFFNAIIKHADKFGHIGAVKKSEKVDVKKTLKTMFASGTAGTRYSGTRTIETTLSGASYILADPTRKIYTRDAKNQGPGFNYPYVTNYDEFTDNDNNWTSAEHSTNKDDAALDAHWGAMMTYDYFKNNHNRDSYDGNGAQIRSYVHVDNNYDNAFWNGAVMSYGDGSSNGSEGNGYFDALTSIDVAAHEIGHAICSHTADLAYQRESGGLNEGFSDIWGAAVEHFAKGNGNDLAPDATVWLIGDEIDRRTGSVALRSMSNPNERNQPDTYGGTYWKEPNCGTPSQSNDYCGVHTNSGVLNYWFYLLTAGGAGTNDINNTFNVTAIGMIKSAKIAYRTEANYLSANATFADARAGSITAATDLYGENSDEVKSVTNAWYAVGVGEAYVENCALAAPGGFESSNINDNDFTLSWTAVSEAISYIVTVNESSYTVNGTSKLITGLVEGTTYTCTVKANCSSGGSGEVSTVAVTTTGVKPISYCASKGENVSDEYIQGVELGSIDNSSDGGNGYSDYTSISTDLIKGLSNTIKITPKWNGTVYNEGYGVWIDYNGDGDFSDVGETVWTKAPSKDTTVSGSFRVPSSALEGSTRMRVVLKYNGTPSACEGSISYGEVEDYTIRIVGANSDTQSPTAPTGLSISKITQTTATLSWLASTDNVGVKEYEVFNGGSSIGVVTGTSANITGLTANTTYSYSVKSKDAAGNVSESSSSLVFTTLGVELNYCSSKGNRSIYEWIDYVSLGGMSHSSSSDGGYGDFTSKVANVSQGSTNQLIVSAGFRNSSYTEFFTVWIDFNQNGVFESSEEVVSGSSRSSSNRRAEITIPSSAKLGSTRMRVSMKYNSKSTPCESFADGEVEDYTVNITAAGSFNGIFEEIEGEPLASEAVTNFMVFPNPATNFVQVKSNSNNNLVYKIVNPIGQVVKTGKMKDDNGVDVSKLEPGLYIIEVNDGQKSMTTNFVKD